MSKLRAFQEKLLSIKPDEPPKIAKAKDDQPMTLEGDETDPSSKPCALHGIPGCESCNDTFGRVVEESDEGWLGHRLMFQKDLRGKDLKQRKESTDDYLVIDPRARNEKALKEEKEIMARKKQVVGEAFRR